MGDTMGTVQICLFVTRLWAWAVACSACTHSKPAQCITVILILKNVFQLNKLCCPVEALSQHHVLIVAVVLKNVHQLSKLCSVLPQILGSKPPFACRRPFYQNVSHPLQVMHQSPS